MSASYLSSCMLLTGCAPVFIVLTLHRYPISHANVLLSFFGAPFFRETEAATLMISRSLPELTAQATAAAAVSRSLPFKLGDAVAFGREGKITGHIRYEGLTLVADSDTGTCNALEALGGFTLVVWQLPLGCLA